MRAITKGAIGYVITAESEFVVASQVRRALLHSDPSGAQDYLGHRPFTPLRQVLRIILGTYTSLDLYGTEDYLPYLPPGRDTPSAFAGLSCATLTLTWWKALMGRRSQDYLAKSPSSQMA